MSEGVPAFFGHFAYLQSGVVGVITNNKSRKRFFSVMSSTSIGSFGQKMVAIFQKRKRLFTCLDQKRTGRASANANANPSISIYVSIYIYSYGTGSGQTESETEYESANVSAAMPMPKLNVVFPEMR